MEVVNQQLNVANDRLRRLEERRTNSGWMNSEIDALVEIRLTYPRNELHIWNAISDRMRERQFERSNSSCSNKFRVLLADFHVAHAQAQANDEPLPLEWMRWIAASWYGNNQI